MGHSWRTEQGIRRKPQREVHMSRSISRRPSPALLVAVVALVAALAGTAVAGPGASSSAITKAKVKKVANKQINKRLPWEAADIAPNAIHSEELAAINTRSQTQALPPTGFAGTEVTANCQAGEDLISGGVNAPNGDVLMGSSHKEGEGWRARLFNFGGAPVNATVEAYCLSA
jgi:hypothetical protein